MRVSPLVIQYDPHYIIAGRSKYETVESDRMNVSNKIILSLKILCIGFLLFASEKIFAAEQFKLAVCPGKAAYYFAEHDIMKGDSSLKYAVIYIHGAKGGAKDAAALMRRKLKKYKAEEKVYCIAPSFFTKKTCPEDKKNDALLWERGWRGGASAINGNKISNFEVIDKIYKIFSDKRLYPQLKRITLVGFSAGGQCVNRYVAAGKMPVSPDIETVFVVGNSAVYLYIDKLRFKNGEFKEVKSNSNFNKWYFGLDNPYPYIQKTDRDKILKNLASRPTLYFCGTADTGKGMLDTSPAAILQGENRYGRFLIYQKYVALFPQWEKMTKFFAVPEIAHSSHVFYHNDIVPKWVFGQKI